MNKVYYDGDIIACASNSNDIYLYNASIGQTIHKLYAHDDFVTALSYHNHTLISASQD